MKAMQAMTRNVVCIQASDSLETARDIMKEWDIRHLPVVDHSRLVGVISDRDILLYSTAAHKGDHIVEDVEVGDVMSKNLITCSPTDSIGRIATIFTDRKIDCLPVVEEDGELVGLVTSTDLLELLKEREAHEASRVIPWTYNLKFHNTSGLGNSYLE